MATATSSSASSHTRSNLGPLTTTFTAPSYCGNVIAECDSCDNGWVAQTCINNAEYAADDTACWPYTTSAAPKANPPFKGWGFYSPGIACPSGYKPACSYSVGQEGGFDFQFQITASEIAVGCCPTGYTCGNGYAQTCRSVASSTSLLTGICPGGGSAINYAFKTIPFPVGSSIVANYTIQAPLFQLVYQPSDLTSTPPGFPMATAAPTSSPSSTDVQNSTIISANSTGTRLSAGAAAGIGVGGAVAVMIVAILSYLLWRSKRKSKTLPTVINSTTTPMTPYSYYSQPYEGAHTPAPSYVYSELSPEDSRKPQEFSSSTTAPVELSAADSNWVQSQAPGAQLPSELEHVSRDHQKVLGLGGIGRTAGQ